MPLETAYNVKPSRAVSCAHTGNAASPLSQKEKAFFFPELAKQIESVNRDPIEAITSVGASPLQIILYGIIPQVIPHILAYTFYRWDINIRMSTIIGFVGGGGIGFLLQQWINLLQINHNCNITYHSFNINHHIFNINIII